MFEKSSSMSEHEKIILSLVELLKKTNFLDSHSRYPEHQIDADDLYTRKIDEHYYKLIHHMSQPLKVMDYLVTRGVMPRSLYSRIFYESEVPEDRCRALIEFICTRAKDLHQPFIEGLYLAGNHHLVELLDGSFFMSHTRQQLDSNYCSPAVLEQPTSVNDEKLRSMNPNLGLEENRNSFLDLNIIETNKFDNELPMGFTVQLLTDEVLEQYPQLDPQKRSIKCYRMLSRPRGLCLIINNVDAFRTMPNREGSDIDGSKLKSLFSQFGFDVVFRRNLIYTEMISVIKNFAILIEENKDTSDCAVVIVLSHGGNGSIYTVDELKVDVEKQIIAEFDDHLVGKPKLFIFQACRGSLENHRLDSSTTKSSWASDGATNVDSGNYKTTQVPLRDDMVVWYSTIKDYVSWRTREEGSLFIQSLITVFARTAWCHDLMTMVDYVNRTMKEKFAAHESLPFQTPCLEYYLNYPLYFNPGAFEKTDADDED